MVEYTDYPILRDRDLVWNGNIQIIDGDPGHLVISANVTDRDAYHSLFDILTKAYDRDATFILVDSKSIRSVKVKIIYHSVFTEKDGLHALLIVEEV